MNKGFPNAVCVIIKESLVEIDVATTVSVGYHSAIGSTLSKVSESQFLEWHLQAL